MRPQPIPKKPTVIGICGISGSGKTYLLNQLSTNLDHQYFKFFDGSDVLDKREAAIKFIQTECAGQHSPKVGLVVGHYSLVCNTNAEGFETIYTPSDLEVYTHIFYLDTEPSLIAYRRTLDSERVRSDMSKAALAKWQRQDLNGLRNLCQDHGILFGTLGSNPFEQLRNLSHDIRIYSREHNARQVLRAVDRVISTGTNLTLVLDADKTLAPFDTGKMFFEHPAQRHEPTALEALFSGKWGYSDQAFRQAMLFYEESSEEKFDQICEDIAARVTMYPEMVSLLQFCSQNSSVGAIVVTSGIRRIWEKVIRDGGLSDFVKIIGGSRLTDGYVVTPENKAQVVARIQEQYGQNVVAFGDSPGDIPMLMAADASIVVVGDENIRSRSMDKALKQALTRDSIFAHQVLLPKNVGRRDIQLLETSDITKESFVLGLCNEANTKNKISAPQIIDASATTASKLLTSPTRDANVSGPTLSSSHRLIGHFLALESISNLTGLEEYRINHVNGTETIAHRFRREGLITIVALMRAGEPLALGINDAMPQAMFVHAKKPIDLMPEHINGRSTIVIADFVINSGKTLLEFIDRVRELHATIRIIIVAGVVQSDFITGEKLHGRANVHLVTLRTSENKYKGKGATDTGHRLFNTTHMD